jgi:hypothetical protein
MGMQRSKLVDKNDYIKWYNFAQDEIKNEELIPHRNKEDIFELISEENWLLFCSKEENKDIAKQKADPNVFFDVLSKEGNLTGFGRLGLTFNNLKSYEKFKTIMKGVNKEIKNNITESLLKLNKDWKIKVSRKTKRYNYAQTPEYSEEGAWDTKDISEKIIDEVLLKSNKIRQEGIINRDKIRSNTGNYKKFYCETPTINLMESEFKLNEDEFRDRISEIFKVLSLCLRVKGDVEVNKIIREKTKRINELYIKLGILSDEIPKKEALKGIVKQITEDSIKSDKERKKEIERELEILESEIED